MKGSFLSDEEFILLYDELYVKKVERLELSTFISVALFVFSFGILSCGLLYPTRVYQRAGQYVALGKYDEAIKDFETVSYFGDSTEQILNARYLKADRLLYDGAAEEAKEIFLALGEDNYLDSRERLKECNYKIASDYLAAGEYEQASGYFLALGSYLDSREQYVGAVYQLILQEGRQGKVQESLSRLHVLIEDGYFTYDILPKRDYEAALTLAEPTSVNISADLSGRSAQWSFYTGSGCIYRITPEYVYCLSAKHVLTSIGEAEAELTFFDGTRVTNKPEMIFSEDERSDLAMFRFPTGELPIDTLLGLREINFKMEYYEDLTEGERAFLYAAYWYQEETLITDTEFLSLDAREASRGNYDNDNYLVFKRCSREGQSGGPVFDTRGRCLAVSSSYYYTLYEDRVVYEVDCYCRLDQAEQLYGEF